MIKAYVFGADDAAGVATGGVLHDALVIINAPITAPLRLETFEARIVNGAVEECKISRHKIFVRFTRKTEIKFLKENELRKTKILLTLTSPITAPKCDPCQAR